MRTLGHLNIQWASREGAGKPTGRRETKTGYIVEAERRKEKFQGRGGSLLWITMENGPLDFPTGGSDWSRCGKNVKAENGYCSVDNYS